MGFGVFVSAANENGTTVRYAADGVWVSLLQAAAGDANGDGSFDQQDIVRLLQGGKYSGGAQADWTEGDFNGDGLFNQADIVAALQTGKYLAD